MNKARPKIPRLVIVDGFNVMRSFQNVIPGFHNPKDERMNAMVLLPLLGSFLKKNIRILIAMQRLPKTAEITHSYIIEELNKMQLLLFPENESPEADDVMMLSFAKTYGAVIISNDRFANHTEYADVAQTNTIKYHKERNPDFSLEKLQKTLMFQYNMTITPDKNQMYCNPDDPMYEKVKESYEIFWPPTLIDMKNFASLRLYLHCYIRSVIGTCPQFMDKHQRTPPTFSEFQTNVEPFLKRKMK